MCRRLVADAEGIAGDGGLGGDYGVGKAGEWTLTGRAPSVFLIVSMLA